MEADILAIAYQCVFYGGPSVIEARSLVATKDVMKYTIEWEDSCTAPSSKWDGKEEPLKTVAPLADYRLVPNFYMGERKATITLGEKERGVLEIYSIDGKLTGTHNLASGENTLDLTRTLNAKGVYVYKVKVNDTYRTTDKLVVIE